MKQTLSSVVVAAAIGLAGCGAGQEPAPAASATQVQARDGRGEFFAYLDSHDVQVVAVGEMHLLDSHAEARARREGIPLTLDLFTDDYLEGFAQRGYYHIVLEHIWQESAHDLDMFYAGVDITAQTTPMLYRNIETVPAGDEVHGLLMRARDMRVCIHPGGMDQDDIQRVIILMELQSMVPYHPEAQDAIDELTHEVFSNIAAHTYRHVHNLIETNPRIKVITYGGMIHNNTELRQEALSVTRGDREASSSLSFAGRIQGDLERAGGAYREVDIVQRDILDIILEGSRGQTAAGGVTPQQFLFEYILLTRQVHGRSPMLRENEQQRRLLLVYGRAQE